MGGPELALAPVGLADAGWVADLLTRCRPSEPTDPEVLRHSWSSFQLAWFRRRLAVVAGGEPVGFANAHHAPWEREPERVGRWSLSLLAHQEAFAACVRLKLEEMLKEEDALLLSSGGWEDDGWLLGELERAGYRFDRLERQWELDLVAKREPLLELNERSRQRMSRLGVELTTLEQLAHHPDIWKRLTAFYTEVEQDIPHSLPIHPMTEEEIRAELGGPDVHLDRVWLALRARQIIGLSFLTYPPRRGHCWTGFTGTARAFRGRGIARAVKIQTLAQAIRLGVPRVRTGNDEHNAAILHINRSLGYEPIPGWVSYIREV